MDDWRAVADEVRNWGRWGPEDQLGTLNLTTPSDIVRAASLIRSGRLFSLSIPLDSDGPQTGASRQNPIRLMSAINQPVDPSVMIVEEEAAGDLGPVRYNDDYVVMPLQAATQWDALSHISYEGSMYNAVPAEAVTTSGAARNDIDVPARRGGVVGRGVLLDVARSLGRAHVEANAIVTREQLDRTATEQEVDIQRGDIVLVRTGWRQRYLEAGRTGWAAEAPGLSWRCAAWCHEHEVAALACDNVAVEGRRLEVSRTALPLHMIAIRDMGMMLGEMWDLEGLAKDCVADGVYEFFLVAAPLRFSGGVGSPVNPVAIK